MTFYWFKKWINILNDQLNLVLISAPSLIHLQYGLLQGTDNSTYFYHNGCVIKSPFQKTDFYWNVLTSLKAIINQSYINCVNSLTCKILLRFKYCSTSVVWLRPEKYSKFSNLWNIKTNFFIFLFLMFVFSQIFMWDLDLALSSVNFKRNSWT